MGAPGTTTQKPVLSLTTVTSFITGGFFFGDRAGEQCIFYMNLADAKALGAWLICVAAGGGIGAVLGLLVNKHYIVKVK